MDVPPLLIVRFEADIAIANCRRYIYLGLRKSVQQNRAEFGLRKGPWDFFRRSVGSCSRERLITAGHWRYANNPLRNGVAREGGGHI